jgi:HK97 family phage major capsid protein
MSIQRLREQRAAIAKTLKDLVEKENWNAEVDQPIYDMEMAKIDEIDAKIERTQAALAKLADDTRTEEVVEAAQRIARNSGDKGLSIYARWIKGGDNALNAEDWAHICNTMSTTTGSEGGFTVDTEVATSVIDALKAFGGLRQVSTVISTSGFGLLSFPTSNGTSEVGELVAENQPATDLDVSFGTVGLPVYKFSSKVVTIPIELLQDSNVDIEAFVQNRMVERLGRITNQLFTTGTGSAQPNGLVTGATVGVTAANGTGQVTTTTYATLVNLQHSVDPAYRANAGWMMSDAAVREIRKIVDGENRPIFVPGYEIGNPGGAPDRLLGQPITINQDVPVFAANNRSIVYGDFSGYYIRDVMAVQMFRFTDSAFTKKGQVGFLAWMRSGGNLVDANKVRVLVQAAS